MSSYFTDPSNPWEIPKSLGSTQVAHPPANPSGSLTLVSGFMPNYADLIKNNSTLLSAQASGKLSLAQAAAQRREALKQMAVRHGGLPTGFTDQYGDITPDVVGLANQNQQSDISQITRQYNDAVFAAKRALAARNASSSGDTSYALDRAAMARAGAQYSSDTSFLDATRQALGGYSQAEQDARLAEADAQTAASQAVYSNPANAPVPEQTATLVGNWQDLYGQPVYQDQWGRLYDANKNAFIVPPPKAPVAPTPVASSAPMAAPYSSPYSGQSPDPATWSYSNGVWTSPDGAITFQDSQGVYLDRPGTVNVGSGRVR